jgi:DNA-directed RNA polymerase specialized sigma24 family protein
MIGIIMATIITFLAIGISLKNAKIKNIQKKQWEIEEMALKKEQELSSRIVEYSKIIIENNQKLKENLNRLLPMVDEKAKSEIRHMLTGAEVLTTLNTEENPGLANQLIGGDDKWEEKYPGFKHLNKTEQRVFVLVQENYKAKEIATLLGVATQYVRNVKTRLRKKLQLPDDWGM